MAIYYPPTVDALQKTLAASLLTGVTASSTFNNVTGVQNLKGLFVVDRVDGNNNLTANKREYISFAGTSGSTVITLVRGLGGSTDQDHAVGAIVEFVNDVVQQQAIIDGLLLTVTTAGALNKATGATINTGTADDTIVTPKAIADSKVSITDKVETLTNKTLTSPKINEDVALTVTATQLNNLAALSNPYKFRAYRSAALTSTAGADTIMPFDAESYDTNNNFTSSAYTVPVTGFYRFSARLSGTYGSAFRMFIGIFNGASLQARSNDESTTTSSCVVTDLLQCTANDVITIKYYTSATVGMDIGAGVAYFSGELVCKT